jgi:hypothetical protein
MGLLDITPPEREEWERQAARERELEMRLAQRAADLQAQYDAIEALLVPLLKDELEAEKAIARVTPRMKQDFGRFRKWCDEAGFPSLPASPQATTEFLGGELKHGAAHVTRLRNSISAVHRAVFNSEDPTQDLLVRALMRCARQDKDNSPQQMDKH